MLTVKHDIMLNGDFEGKLFSSSKLYIEKNAKVMGDIAANEIEIKGSVKGSCYVKGNVKLCTGSRVEGKLLYGDIEIENGAVVCGVFEQLKNGEYEKVVRENKAFKQVLVPSAPAKK